MFVLPRKLSPWWCSHAEGKGQTSPCEERYISRASVEASSGYLITECNQITACKATAKVVVVVSPE